ncbi:hypothetical protein ES703_72174 [subsurface metagenome]
MATQNNSTHINTKDDYTQLSPYLDSNSSGSFCQASPEAMAHRKALIDKERLSDNNVRETSIYGQRYGVPPSRKILTVDLFNTKFLQIRDYLVSLGMHTAEREGVLRLLRLYSYYGQAYPKAAQLSELPGCSRRTFWRAISRLKDMGLVNVINRFLNGRQISNCYRLDKLILCLVRYLVEHGGAGIFDKIGKAIKNFLFNRHFWRLVWSTKVSLAKDQIFLGGTSC